jgi:hypothetical protein
MTYFFPSPLVGEGRERGKRKISLNTHSPLTLVLSPEGRGD